MSNRGLEGRVAIVAGASRGIGMGSAVELGAGGAFVYALGRTLEPGTGDFPGSLMETVDLIESLGGKGVPIPCDCTNEEELTAVFRQVEAEHGRLDVLVNSVFASPSFGASIGQRFWEMPIDAWRKVVDLGARSAYIASVLAAPLLMNTARENGSPSLIVNVSGRGSMTYRYNVVYGVGKAAMQRMTHDMALELKEHNVAVISIWPNGHVQPPAPPETPRYNGRAVAGLATDPNLMTRSGDHFWSAELAVQYKFTDEHGTSHPVGDLNDDFSRPRV